MFFLNIRISIILALDLLDIILVLFVMFLIRAPFMVTLVVTHFDPFAL
jgi:hypothetical protein